jgi:hypothetical protein
MGSPPSKEASKQDRKTVFASRIYWFGRLVCVVCGRRGAVLLGPSDGCHGDAMAQHQEHTIQVQSCAVAARSSAAAETWWPDDGAQG